MTADILPESELDIDIDFDSIAKAQNKRNGNRMPFWLFDQCPTLCDYTTSHGPSQTRHWSQHLGTARGADYAPSRRLQAWDVYEGDAIKCTRGGITHYWNVLSADALGADDDNAKVFFVISHPNNDAITDNILARWDKELTVKQYSLPPSKR